VLVILWAPLARCSSSGRSDSFKDGCTTVAAHTPPPFSASTASSQVIQQQLPLVIQGSIAPSVSFAIGVER
jgi:hypothetical protein